jgi:hypothetical protein
MEDGGFGAADANGFGTADANWQTWRTVSVLG